MQEFIKNIVEGKSERVYLKDRGVLAYFKSAATAEYWDNHWGSLTTQHITSNVDHPILLPFVKKYLPQGASILEGGCGIGGVVHALHVHGYRAIGIDYAKRTIEQSKSLVPFLDLRHGDIRELPFADNQLDGHVSLGVIEHFWSGYQPILQEMHRTLRIGGYVFLTFPSMSPLRKFKAALGAYPVATTAELDAYQANFYQFALDWQQVLPTFSARGFSLVEVSFGDGIKGFKDEATWFKPFLQKMYDGLIYQSERPGMDELLVHIANHFTLLVLQKVR